MTSTPALLQQCARLSGQPSPSRARVTVTTDPYSDSTVRVIALSDPDKLNAIGDGFVRGWIGR